MPCKWFQVWGAGKGVLLHREARGALQAKNAAILTSKKLDASRRLMFGSFLLPFAAPIAAVVPFAANASGGATAGGAYLLSAKQRYNERVVAGEKTQRSSIAYP